MITSHIALLLNSQYEHISPDTHVDSLYIERALNRTDASVLVERYSVYKHFPIAVNKAVIGIPNSEFCAGTPSSQLKDVHPYYKRTIGKFSEQDKTSTIHDLKIASLTKSDDTISSTSRSLFNLNIDRVNLSIVLWHYASKMVFYYSSEVLSKRLDAYYIKKQTQIEGINDTSLVNLDASVSHLNTSVNDLSTYADNVSTRIKDLEDEIPNMWKCLLDTSLYSLDSGKPYKQDVLLALANSNGLEPGCRYLMKYVPETLTDHQFVIMLIAISKSEFAKKVIPLSYNTVNTLFGSDYMYANYSNAKIELWDLEYSISTNVITYMKDEWGNEAPYDFKAEKTFIITGIQTPDDYTTYSNTHYCLNNVIKCVSTQMKHFKISVSNAVKIMNNYFGYDTSFVSDVSVTRDMCNNYIGNNNIDVTFTDSSDCYIGNNNYRPMMYHANSCRIGNNTSLANIHEDQLGLIVNPGIVKSSQIDSSCTSVKLRGSYNHVYQNCNNIETYNNATYVNIYPSNTVISTNYKKCQNVNIHYAKTSNNTPLYFPNDVSNYDCFATDTSGNNKSDSFYFDGTIYCSGTLYEN